MGLAEIGPRGSRLLEIGSPDIDWVALARSLGVAARQAKSMDELSRGIDAALIEGGPQLIEVVL